MTKQKNEKRKDCKRWTLEEDRVLERYVRARPQNLKFCFTAVAEEIGRTPTAVQAHWYSVVSKKQGVWCFFTASPKHVSKNRKNGEGVPTDTSLWKKFLAAMKGLSFWEKK